MACPGIMLRVGQFRKKGEDNLDLKVHFRGGQELPITVNEEGEIACLTKDCLPVRKKGLKCQYGVKLRALRNWPDLNDIPSVRGPNLRVSEPKVDRPILIKRQIGCQEG